MAKSVRELRDKIAAVKAKAGGQPLPPEVQAAVDRMEAKYGVAMGASGRLDRNIAENPALRGEGGRIQQLKTPTLFDESAGRAGQLVRTMGSALGSLAAGGDEGRNVKASLSGQEQFPDRASLEAAAAAGNKDAQRQLRDGTANTLFSGKLIPGVGSTLRSAGEFIGRPAEAGAAQSLYDLLIPGTLPQDAMVEMAKITGQQSLGQAGAAKEQWQAGNRGQAIAHGAAAAAAPIALAAAPFAPASMAGTLLGAGLTVPPVADALTRAGQDDPAALGEAALIGGLAAGAPLIPKAVAGATAPARRVAGKYGGELAGGAVNVSDEYLEKTMGTNAATGAKLPPTFGGDVLDATADIIKKESWLPTNERLLNITNGIKKRIGEYKNTIDQLLQAEPTTFDPVQLKQTVKDAVLGKIAPDSPRGQYGTVTKGTVKKLSAVVAGVYRDINALAKNGPITAADLNTLIGKIDDAAKALKSNVFAGKAQKAAVAEAANLRSAREALRQVFDEGIANKGITDLNHKISELVVASEGLHEQYLAGTKTGLLGGSMVTPGKVNPASAAQSLAGAGVLSQLRRAIGGSATELKVANLLRSIAPDDMKWTPPSPPPAMSGTVGAAAGAAGGGGAAGAGARQGGPPPPPNRRLRHLSLTCPAIRQISPGNEGMSRRSPYGVFDHIEFFKSSKRDTSSPFLGSVQ